MHLVINMVRYYYPGIDVGNLTLYQFRELTKDLVEIKKLESGTDQKDEEHMTAAEKTELWEQQGRI
jgi:hypothetical protein